MQAMLCMRPNIANVVIVTRKFQVNLSGEHWNAIVSLDTCEGLRI